ncbi:MAG: LysM peptidoglycan-binding domain-containing protein [Sandaracinus sp.]|nr:LysM peptidoglycan-binding domain-containing protein [Sandaracinus sp.]
MILRRLKAAVSLVRGAMRRSAPAARLVHHDPVLREPAVVDHDVDASVAAANPTPRGRRARVGLAVLLALGGVPLASSAQEGSGTIVLGRNRHAPAAFIPDVYTVERGDTLWDITGRFYGNPYEWPKIWSYNPEITNPHWIYPLDRLRLRGEGEAPTVLAGPTTEVRAPARAAPGTVWLREQGFLDEEALRDAGVIVGSPEEQMMLSTFDDVYVRFEDQAQVQVGREYTIYRPIDEDEREPEESGDLVRIFGTVRLRTYDRERGIGRGTIIEALDPIERGFHIAPIPRRFESVPPRENVQELEAEVVASLRPTRIHADQQIVFVNAGSEQQVQVGNRFFVVRRGDEWRDSLTGGLDYGNQVESPDPDDDLYPPEVVAEGRVVDVRQQTSTLLITGATREVAVGDRVEMRRGF